MFTICLPEKQIELTKVIKVWVGFRIFGSAKDGGNMYSF